MHYRVGSIDVDTLNYHLSENGNPVAVEPQVFDLIVYLITNRERLVTRQEIFDNIWQGRVVSDTSLSNHIKSARKALGDDGKKQLVIKTIHGRGYQFIADTEEVADQEGSTNYAKVSSLLTEKKPKPHRLTTKSTIFSAFFFVLLILMVSGGWWFIFGQNNANKSSEAAQSSNAGKSIAVLAFSDLSPEKDQEYFSDGLSDELINLLAKIPELRVISRTSAFSFKGKNASTEEIGNQLNVTHILEGSVRKAGNRLRITTQLIQVSDESHLWSETFDETMDDVFRVQDDIAQAVTKQLKITLLEAADKTTTVNPDAYTLFLNAKYLFHKYTPETTGKAELLVNESIAMDPHYAPSWHLLSAILVRSALNFNSKPYKEGLEQAKSAAEKAIELDTGFAPAYATLARVNLVSWEFKTANTNINKALLLDSSNADVLNVASIVAIYSGKIDDAIAYLQRAIKIDPLEGTHYFNLSLNYVYLNQLDEATEFLKKYDLFHPDAAIQHSLMAWIMLAQGKCKSALEEAGKEPHEFFKLFAKSAVLFCLGKTEKSDSLLTQFIEQHGDIHPTYVAYLYATRKENDRAFKWLDIAFQQQDPALLEQINFNQFRNLWSDPRWDAFLNKLGLPEGHWLLDRESRPKI